MKIKITIPTSYDDITIDQYQRITAVLKMKSLTPEDRNLALLSILTNRPVKELVNVRAADIDKVTGGLAWLLNIPAAEELPLVDRFHLDGKEYGFIPDPQNMSVGEFADLESKTSDLSTNLHEIAAILYRPVTRRFVNHYAIEPYAPTLAKKMAMKQAPLGAVMSAVVFFYTFESRLAATLQSSLKEEPAAPSEASGDGTKPSTDSPTETPSE